MTDPPPSESSAAADDLLRLGPSEVLEIALTRVPGLSDSQIANLRAAAANLQHRVEALKNAVSDTPGA
jgi:phage head maturation protease